MKRLYHLPYSLNLAPSDSYLFGYLKMMLDGTSFDTPEDLFWAVRNILEEVPSLTLAQAYEEWMRRLRICIEQKGEFK